MRMSLVLFRSGWILLFLLAAISLIIWEYGSPISRRGLSDLNVASDSSVRPTTVSIDGSLISSSLAVSSVKQFRNGSCIVVVVREGIIRPGRKSGRFHLNIGLTDDIDEIAFGNSKDVIWRR